MPSCVRSAKQTPCADGTEKTVERVCTLCGRTFAAEEPVTICADHPGPPTGAMSKAAIDLFLVYSRVADGTDLDTIAQMREVLSGSMKED